MDRRTVGEKASDNWEELKDQAKVRSDAAAEHLKADQRIDKTAKDVAGDLNPNKSKEEVKAEGLTQKISNAASDAWESTKETASSAWEKTKDVFSSNK